MSTLSHHLASLGRTLTMGGLVSSSLLGCAGSETGNAGREVLDHPVVIELRLTADTNTDGPVAVDREGLELPITRATAVVESIELVLPEGESCGEQSLLVEGQSIVCGEDDEASLEVKGPWLVDLLTGAFEPPLDDLLLPEGAYEQIRLHMLGKEGAPSLAIGGVIELEGGERDFELLVNQAIPARFSSEDGIVLNDEVIGLSLDLAVESWFATLDLGGCLEAGAVPEVDGMLQLAEADKRVCGDIVKTVREFLTVGGRAKVDREGNANANAASAMAGPANDR